VENRSTSASSCADVPRTSAPPTTLSGENSLLKDTESLGPRRLDTAFSRWIDYRKLLLKNRPLESDSVICETLQKENVASLPVGCILLNFGKMPLSVSKTIELDTSTMYAVLQPRSNYSRSRQQYCSQVGALPKSTENMWTSFSWSDSQKVARMRAVSKGNCSAVTLAQHQVHCGLRPCSASNARAPSRGVWQGFKSDYSQASLETRDSRSRRTPAMRLDYLPTLVLGPSASRLSVRALISHHPSPPSTAPTHCAPHSGRSKADSLSLVKQPGRRPFVLLSHRARVPPGD